MTTCTRRIQFCAGHRVYGHESKCANLHGHNYVAMVTAAAECLDGIGRVIDFSVLKDRVGGWIDDNWDHGMVLWVNDKATIDAVSGLAGTCNGSQKLFLLPTNPTAENMAEHLVTQVCPVLLRGTGVVVESVELWETENCKATYVRK